MNAETLKVQPFNLIDNPLEGTTLIEASAGTGKTYTIAGLFLRLIVEKGLDVDKILVVTFTDAATNELKDRIRANLLKAEEIFSTGKSDDDIFTELLKRADKNGGRTEALKRLKAAVCNFDESAIFTIHGFCKRMLSENAFESSRPFDTELITDQDDIKQEIAEDFWRKHLYSESQHFVNYVINNIKPSDLQELIDKQISQPGIEIIPKPESIDISDKYEEINAAFDKLRTEWQSSKENIRQIFAQHPGLNRNMYRLNSIDSLIKEMDNYLSAKFNMPIFDNFIKFTTSGIKNGKKNAFQAPAHKFFDLCEHMMRLKPDMERLFEKRLIKIKIELMQYAAAELKKRKQINNTQSFDDLLVDLYNAIEKNSGEKLVNKIREKFKAALIDEFQDTDPIQYKIFKKIFDTTDTILFLIGDPKQAIYGFRGADIFAYIDAASRVKCRFTLEKNWRSEPGLIKAVNTIFKNSGKPFLFDEICFRPTDPAEKEQNILKIQNGENHNSFLHIWFMDAKKYGDGKTITKYKARDLIPKAVAGEISNLIYMGINNRAFIGKESDPKTWKPIDCSDIAVLVMRNSEARLIRDALLKLNIPSVLYNTGNIFDTHEAMEMERFFSAVAEPSNEKRIKAALTTDMIGLSCEDLDHIIQDDTGMEEWFIRFKKYHDIWEKYSFIRLFHHLMYGEKILKKLMAFPDGERRNTNLLHLSEILHQACHEKKLSMSGLIKWLSEQRQEQKNSEEHLLRLETDEKAVKIVTIHKSKGLEYPIVFCPFSWDEFGAKNKKNKPVLFHNEADCRHITIDLGSTDIEKNREQVKTEELAESLRLFYVALTRAKNRSYLICGDFKTKNQTALDHLFQNGKKKLDSAIIKKGCDNSGVISFSDLPSNNGHRLSSYFEKQETLNNKEISGTIDRSLGISSFSYMTGSLKPHSIELADYDSDNDLRQSDEYEEKPQGFFAFPKGRKAGTFLHDIFEHLNFTEKNKTAIDDLIASKLDEHGFDETWKDKDKISQISQMINNVLSVPLEPARNDFTLSRIEDTDRLNELEFYFPLNKISTNDLKKIFKNYGTIDFLKDFPERMDSLYFNPIQGFMKGFIDMVFCFEDRFYIVDWKSNYLGTRVEDYRYEALIALMKSSYYVLQYHIYTIALHQYLRLRRPGYDYTKHFGGVFYIFLRGVDIKRPDYGIFRDKPSEDLINELCAKLVSSF